MGRLWGGTAVGQQTLAGRSKAGGWIWVAPTCVLMQTTQSWTEIIEMQNENKNTRMKKQNRETGKLKTHNKKNAQPKMHKCNPRFIFSFELQPQAAAICNANKVMTARLPTARTTDGSRCGCLRGCLGVWHTSIPWPRLLTRPSWMQLAEKLNLHNMWQCSSCNKQQDYVKDTNEDKAALLYCGFERKKLRFHCNMTIIKKPYNNLEE